MSKVRLPGVYLNTDKPQDKIIWDYVNNHTLKQSQLVKLALMELMKKENNIQIKAEPISSETKVIKCDERKLLDNEIGDEIDI